MAKRKRESSIGDGQEPAVLGDSLTGAGAGTFNTAPGSIVMGVDHHGHQGIEDDNVEKTEEHSAEDTEVLSGDEADGNTDSRGSWDYGEIEHLDQNGGLDEDYIPLYESGQPGHYGEDDITNFWQSDSFEENEVGGYLGYKTVAGLRAALCSEPVLRLRRLVAEDPALSALVKKRRWIREVFEILMDSDDFPGKSEADFADLGPEATRWQASHQKAQRLAFYISQMKLDIERCSVNSEVMAGPIEPQIWSIADESQTSSDSEEATDRLNQNYRHGSRAILQNLPSIGPRQIPQLCT